MDTLFHGFSGAAPFLSRSKSEFRAAFVLGMMPDLLSFGILFPFQVVQNGFGKPELHQIPEFVSVLYQFTHSLLLIFLLFGVIWWIRKKPYWPLAAWILHILVDIPTHSKAFFPTPFLFPLSEYTFDGVSWGRSSIWGVLWGVMIVWYVGYWLFRFRKRKNLL